MRTNTLVWSGRAPWKILGLSRKGGTDHYGLFTKYQAKRCSFFLEYVTVKNCFFAAVIQSNSYNYNFLVSCISQHILQLMNYNIFCVKTKRLSIEKRAAGVSWPTRFLEQFYYFCSRLQNLQSFIPLNLPLSVWDIGTVTVEMSSLFLNFQPYSFVHITIRTTGVFPIDDF